jgi:phosphate/sulfate permease
VDHPIWVLIPIIAVGGFYVMVALIVFFVVRGRQARAAMRAEVQTRMLDRFSTAPEFVSFLQSDQGKGFVSQFEELPRAHARDRILGGVTRSIVLTLLGLGFLAICLTEARDEGFIIAGCILLALGVGYCIATFVTFRMSKSWGLLPRQNGNEPSQ